jgi:CheY-like chemotaxis protein
MAKILSVASTEVLRTTRQLLLEQQGYSVISAVNLSEVEALAKAKAEKVDLAVIGHGFRGLEKLKIAHTVNRYFPGLPILEMCYQSPEIPGADFVLSDSPHDLITAIKLVLAGRRVRGYAD